VPVLGLSILELERLYDNDRHWIYRAIAVQQAEALAVPIHRRHAAKRRTEEQAAARERERAAIREQKRELWRSRQGRKQPEGEPAMSEAD
jgi:hypothetical protein